MKSMLANSMLSLFTCITNRNRSNLFCLSTSPPVLLPVLIVRKCWSVFFTPADPTDAPSKTYNILFLKFGQRKTFNKTQKQTNISHIICCWGKCISFELDKRDLGTQIRPLPIIFRIVTVQPLDRERV